MGIYLADARRWNNLEKIEMPQREKRIKREKMDRDIHRHMERKKNQT